MKRELKLLKLDGQKQAQKEHVRTQKRTGKEQHERRMKVDRRQEK
jgi:hypothetical protein